MINVAVLGYGTIGAGVVKVLQTNVDSIEKRVLSKDKTLFWWAIRDSNLGPTGYEPVALTN